MAERVFTAPLFEQLVERAKRDFRAVLGICDRVFGRHAPLNHELPEYGAREHLKGSVRDSLGWNGHGASSRPATRESIA